MIERQLRGAKATAIVLAFAAVIASLGFAHEAKGRIRAEQALAVANATNTIAVSASEGRTAFCMDVLKGHSRLAEISATVASIPYQNPGANCYDHSKLLQKQLAAAGIASSIMINHDRSHAWVAVWMEANTGAFVPPGLPYGPVLELRDEKLNVFCTR